MSSEKKQCLTNEQKRIVEFGVKNNRIAHYRPLTVSAGAGTGKTETIAAFVARRLEAGVEANRILVLAFNREAASDLQGRINGKLTRLKGKPSVQCATFHATGLRFIRKFAHHLDLPANFTTLGDDGARQMMQEAIASFEINIEATECRRIYSFWKGSLRSLKSVLQGRWINHLSYSRDLRRAFRRYEAAKRASDVIDFNDMLGLWDDLLADKRIECKIRSDFDYVIVDEYQDTSALQDRILNRLRQDGHGLVVVGDDCQCICGFRGVETGAVERRSRQSKCLSLTRNFRSTQPILDAANALIAASVATGVKPLWSKRTRAPKPVLVEVGNEALQARFVVDEIRQAFESGVALKEQAVLARTAEELQSFIRELDRHKIPYRKVGGVNFYDTPEIASVIALLKWSENPSDRFAARQTLELDNGISAKDKEGILAEATREITWKQFLQRPNGVSVDKWKKFEALCKAISRASWDRQIAALKSWFGKRDERISRSVAREFINLARSYEDRTRFLDAVSLDNEAHMSRQEGGDRLTLSTIHSAKGKQWTSVYIINSVDGCLPIQHATSAEAMAEERRVAFVGLTRARRNLTLVMPRRLRRLGQARVQLARTPFVPARFLDLYAVSHKQ